MSQRAVFIFLFLTTTLFVHCQNTLNKKIFYEAMAGENTDLMDEQLLKLKNQTEYAAHEGALLMKRAGLNGNPNEKLNLFKFGKNKLEKAIKKDSSNVEYRFLRLMVQENTPKLLQYNDQKKSDAAYIRKHYSDMENEVQQALYDYSKKSAELKSADLKNLKHD